MFNKMKRNFLTGVVVILPTVLTVVIFVFLAKQVNENILAPIIKLLGLHFYNPYWTYISKAAGFLIIILVITLI
ncbi:MAG: hypothetical protein KKA80_01975, partial [Candidatus Omnitrophica bacterium]|nr:hypothetical protein [Candidatus Omnitrophota bacterium]